MNIMMNTVNPKYLIFFIVTFTIHPSYTQNECIMPLNTNAEIEKQPLLFIGNYGVYNLAIPKIKDGKLSVFVENSDKIKLACSPAGNSINIYQHIYEGSCKTGRITWLNEEKKEVSEKRVFEAKCLNAHQFALRHTRQQCNNAKGEIYEVGILYKLGNRKKTSYRNLLVKNDLPTWYTTATICYNKSTTTAIYTKHVLYGQSIAFRQKITLEKNFDYNFGKIFSIAYRTYRQQYEKENPALPIDSQYKDGEMTFYSDMQLVPTGDMLLLNWYHATYSHMNIVPMWHIITCTWQILEDKIRKKAAEMKTSLTIYTGSFEPSHYLPRKLAKYSPLYFKATWNALAAISYWKIVVNEESRKGIAFVLQNVLRNKKVVNGDVNCAKYNWVFNEQAAFTGIISCWSLPYFFKSWDLQTMDELKGVNEVLGEEKNRKETKTAIRVN